MGNLLTWLTPNGSYPGVASLAVTTVIHFFPQDVGDSLLYSKRNSASFFSDGHIN